MLAATDLAALIGEHVSLKRRGREFVGLCPFHDDRTPSLAVVTHKGNAFYKCFSCGAAGNAITFVMEHLRMDFPGALRFLAQRAGITLAPPSRAARRDGEPHVDRDALIEANSTALVYWRKLLNAARAGRSTSPTATAATAMLTERAIDDEMVEQFQLGVSSDSWDDLVELVKARQLDQGAFVAAGLLKRRPNGEGVYDAFRNRLIFPICDEAGRAIAFGARKLDPADEPKYLNSSESNVFNKSRTLYGLHLARRPIIDAGEAIVTEGYTDVIACHRAGFRNAVATLGTALTADHARVLRRFCERVTLLFDGDEAGLKAAERAAGVFFAEPIEVDVCVLPDGLDPDDLLRRPDGRERFAAAMAARIPILSFLLDRFTEGLAAATSISARQQRIEAFLGRLAELGLSSATPLRRRLVLEELARRVRLPVADLEAAMPAARSALRPARIEDEDQMEGKSEALAIDDAPAFEEVPTSTAMQRAEGDLLGLLLRHPELCSERVDAGDGHRLPVVEAWPAAMFSTRSSRSLAQSVLPLLEEALATHTEVGMQTLLANLAQPAARALASDLYLVADKRTAGRLETAIELLHQTCAALDAARRRRGVDEPDRPPLTNDLEEAQRRLTLARQRGHDPAAFTRFSSR